MTKDIYPSAKELIVKAAEKSGLLQEVAEYLWFASKVDTSRVWLGGRSLAGELVTKLAEAFDDHTCLAALCADSFFGVEGIGISPGPDEAHEVDAFIG